MQDKKDRIFFKYCFKCDSLYKYNQEHCFKCSHDDITYRETTFMFVSRAIRRWLIGEFLQPEIYLKNELNNIKCHNLESPTKLLDVELFYCLCEHCGSIYFGVIPRGDEPTYEEKCNLCESFNYPRAISTLYFKFLYTTELAVTAGVNDGSMIVRGTILGQLISRAMVDKSIRVFDSVYKHDFPERTNLFKLRHKQLVEKNNERIRSNKDRLIKKIANDIVGKILK